ncbi:MAG TPA: hypothetical protein VKK61_04615, partial [Tepidisphaeraceae bacterium]|nr:hypothetical protein [Tepidisphaeraceae bacterium]
GPALSAMIRDRIAEKIEPQWAAMATAMQTLRPMIREKVAPGNRRKIYVELISDEAFAELDRGGVEGLISWIGEKFSEIRK